MLEIMTQIRFVFNYNTSKDLGFVSVKKRRSGNNLDSQKKEDFIF